MVKRITRPTATQPASVQLLLFPERASLARIRPELNQWRYYRLDVWPDLFGRALVMRHWGRIGTRGVMRLDLHADHGAAVNALAGLLRIKKRRGYLSRGVANQVHLRSRVRDPGVRD